MPDPFRTGLVSPKPSPRKTGAVYANSATYAYRSPGASRWRPIPQGTVVLLQPRVIAYSRRALEALPWQFVSDTFHVDGEMVMPAGRRGLRIREVSISHVYRGERSYPPDPGRPHGVVIALSVRLALTIAACGSGLRGRARVCANAAGHLRFLRPTRSARRRFPLGTVRGAVLG
jgi:hypothetical protein